MAENQPRHVEPTLFKPGLIVYSYAAHAALEAAGFAGPDGISHERAGAAMPGARYLNRHLSGDFGDVDEEVRQTNLSAIEGGHRIYSRYRLSTGDHLLIITEAANYIKHRPQTAIRLATEASKPL